MSIKAKIYRPAKTAMQSGRRKTKHWIFEYEPVAKHIPDPLMGWNSGGTIEQIVLEFPTEAEAIAYAEKKGVAYEIIEPHERLVKPKQYANNFAWNRELPF